MLKNLRINGHESSVYFVSEGGKVFTTEKDGSLRELAYHITDGYHRVKLDRDIPRGMYRVNRIVAETFIPNPNNLPIVHHKNDVRTDDYVDNLEWTNNSYNQKQRFASGKYIGTKCKRVQQLDAATGDVIKEFESPIYAFKELGIQAQNISKVCKGLRNLAGGFKWRYVDDDV